jgi:hypothetical protein
MRNQCAKRGGLINKNLAGCLQRYVVAGYEKLKTFICKYEHHSVANNSLEE